MRSRILALPLLVLAGVAGWLAFRKPVAPAPSESTGGLQDSTAQAPRESASAEREPIRDSGELPPSRPPVSLEVRGVVVDLDGKGLPDLRVRESGEESESAISGPDGSFAIRPATEHWVLVIEQEGWMTLHPASFDDLQGARIIAVPSTPVDGRVADHSGRPLPGARIEFALHAASWRVYAGFEGRFREEALPAVPRVRATASLAGWQTAERFLDLPSSEEIVFVLDREDPDSPEIEGDVVHADGSPAANALVIFGSTQTRTDARGAFHLVCGWFDTGTPLVAIERGLEPAVVERFGASLLSRLPAPPAHLVLAGPARKIAGRVVDARGDPCKGFDVHLIGATPLDPGGMSRDVAEFQAAGPIRCRTDAHGAFQLGGLRDQAYGVMAAGARRSTFEKVVRRDGIDAGTLDLVIMVPDPDDVEHAPIRGQVRTLAGAPVARARVDIGRAVPPGSADEYASVRSRGLRTGNDGRFEIAEAPTGLVFLIVRGDSILPARVELAPGAPRDAISVLVRERREIRVDTSRASPVPDATRALDAAGQAIPLWIGRPDNPLRLGIVPLRREGIADPHGVAGPRGALGGTFGPLGAGDDVRWIVLLRSGREIARVPVPAGTGPFEIVWP